MLNISIIIATYNRSHNLALCLDDILKQKTDDHFIFDVIIADNNSNDSTRAVVRSFEERFPGQVKYILERRQGKCNALNTAILTTEADIVALTDDDVRVDHQWLLNIVSCFQTHDCDGVGGRILPIYTPQTPAWVKENISQLAGAIIVYDHGTDTRIYQKPAYEFLGANYAFRRQVFDDCGLFRTDIGPGKGTFGDDTEFVNRVLRSGKKLYYCGGALVSHPVDIQRTTLKYIAQWNIALGRYRVMVDEQGKIDRSLVYWFGIPRYLIGEMVHNFFQALLNVFNRRRFLESWISLARNWGKAKEIQCIYKRQDQISQRQNVNSHA